MIRTLFSLIIIFYQKTISPDTGLVKYCGLSRGFVCGSYPSCSEYTKKAVLTKGVIKGVLMGVKKVILCNNLRHKS